MVESLPLRLTKLQECRYIFLMQLPLIQSNKIDLSISIYGLVRREGRGREINKIETLSLEVKIVRIN